MLQSDLFTKTLKQAPKDEESVNAKLLIRAGFIDKLGAGIYNFLPLGLKVLNKINNIIRKEMNAIAGQEILMAALHPLSAWDVTGRFKVEEMFKLKSQTGKDYGLGWTHEEIITPLVKKFVVSYKDLPKYVYQIQTKMRDELRVKSGLLRTREFLMKDLYSFHASEDDLNEYYEKVADAYFKIFKHCGILEKTYRTLAFGGTFSKYSDEFQTIADIGEDIIHICKNCDRAINDELINEVNPHTKRELALSAQKKIEYSRSGAGVKNCPDCGKIDFRKEKAIEVGNIFKLGTGFTAPFGFNFRDKDGKEKPVIMGCYGIGPTRLMAAIVEVFHDDKGIIWPKEVSPFDIHLILISSKNEKINKQIIEIGRNLHDSLQNQGKDVLLDNRDYPSAGEKFSDSDLIGILLRMVISERTLEKKSVEIKKRDSNKLEMVKIKEINKIFINE